MLTVKHFPNQPIDGLCFPNFFVYQTFSDRSSNRTAAFFKAKNGWIRERVGAIGLSIFREIIHLPASGSFWSFSIAMSAM